MPQAQIRIEGGGSTAEAAKPNRDDLRVQAPLARDRIAQAYLGLWGDEETQRRARNRVDWLAGRAEGPRVLDIGCSEGILAILLAREGHQVTAVDVHPEAIAYANELAANEQSYVQERLTFLNVDLFAAELPATSFDTIVLGEILEHLNQPQKMLEHAFQLLKPGGRALITTPFGYMPDPDHRQSFMPSDLAAFLDPFCSIEQLSVEDGYIRLTCTGTPSRGRARGKESRAGVDLRDLLQRTEAGALEAQHSLRARMREQAAALADLRSTRRDLSRSLDERSRTAAGLQRELDERSEQLAALRADLDARSRELDRLQRSDAALRTELDQRRQVEQKLQRDLEDRSKHLTEIQETTSALQVELDQRRQAEQTLQRDLEDRSKHLTEIQETTSALQVELDQRRQAEQTLQRDLEDRSKHLTEIQEAAGALQAEADQLRRAASQLQTHLDERNLRIQELEREQVETIAQYDLTAAELRTQLRNLQRKADSQATALEESGQIAAARLEELKELQEKRRSLLQDLERRTRTYQQADRQRADLQARLDAANLKYRRVGTQLSEYKKLAREEMSAVLTSARYQLGDALIGALKPSRASLRLPLTLWRIHRERKLRRRAAAPVAVPAPSRQAGASEQRARFEEQFDRFHAHLQKEQFPHFVVMFGGTTYIQGIRANRPIRLTRSLVRSGIPVLFNFHRWRDTEFIPEYENPLLFQSPSDLTPLLIKRLIRARLPGTRCHFIVSYPHPSVVRLVNLANANGWSTLYDCRDDWEEFSKVGMANWYRRSVEAYVVNNCDATCCVSWPLQKKIQGMTSTRTVHLSPNGYDPEFAPRNYRRTPGPTIKIGYFGHLTDRWFDWESLSWIAEQRPEYRFEMIGHGAPDGLAMPSNVSLLGPKTHEEISEIAKGWHVGIIPFRIGALADAVDPIKIYEYLALKLPVVSFRMPQIADYPYTTTVETRHDFVAALDLASRTHCRSRVLRGFLSRNSWDVRATQLLEWGDAAIDAQLVEKLFCSVSGAGS